MKIKMNFAWALAALAPLIFGGCNSDSTTKQKKEAAQNSSAARQVYVPPGKLDDCFSQRVQSKGQRNNVRQSSTMRLA